MDSGNIVVFTASGQEMKLLNKKLPELRPGEILVQNHYTTICGSDLHTFCGLRKEKTPTVLGHEIVGKVIKISDAHSGKITQERHFIRVTSLRGVFFRPMNYPIWHNAECPKNPKMSSNTATPSLPTTTVFTVDWPNIPF